MYKIYFFVLLISLGIHAQTPCDNGFASNYPCQGYDLISSINLDDFDAQRGNDSWGWTDPLDNKEYAIVGLDNGTAFVDISIPENPIYLGKLPTHTVSSIWRDIKVYNNYAFIVSEASNHGMQVFDLTRLRDVQNTPAVFTADQHYDQFGNAHNIVINPDQPYAYVVGTNTFAGGPHIVDISDPLNPTFAGGYAEAFYTHDAQVLTYDGPDPDYQGVEIFIGSNEDEVVILNVSDKTNITNIASVTYSNLGYTHQAWLTEDRNYLLLGDEFDELNFGFKTRTLIFDLTNLDNPTFFTEYIAQNSSIDHNGYILGNLFYLASYNAGMRVIDISDIANQNLTEIGYFDTFPDNNIAQFRGLWNVYPYFGSGNLVLSDIDSGLFILRDSSLSTTYNDIDLPVKVYPNPAEDLVYINSLQPIEQLRIFDTLGRIVLEKENIQSKNYKLSLNELERGVYILNINNKTNKKLVLR